MALQSEVSPPMVGDPNKDIKIDGDTKSEEDDSSQDSDTDVDLEEGEILDSGAEEEKEKDYSNSSLKDALDKNCLQNIEQLISQAKNADDGSSPNTKNVSPRKLSKRHNNYMDQDRPENSPDHNDNWFPRSPKHKKSESRPIDYRNELEAYRGTPPSSPDRKKRDDKSRRKKSSKKSKKSSRKTITRKDAKGHRVMRYKKEAAKRKLCKYFQDGKCAKGADCPFSHALPEQKFKKKELCKFYLSGHCNKGKHCVYMHGDFPCKFYHTGSVCYAKDDCRFSHEPLTDETKKILADYLRHVHGDRDHHRDDFIRDDDRDHERDHGERDRERKRRHSESPEPNHPHRPETPPPPAPKRVCLLGSPPRRIRESEETKRWQEEMKFLQQQNHPSFEINLLMSDEDNSPPHIPKPNFYQETLLNSSPQRHLNKLECPPPGPHPLGPPPGYNGPMYPPPRNFNERPPLNNYPFDAEFPEENNTPLIKQEPEEDFGWEDSQNTSDIKPEPNDEYNDNTQQEFDFTNDVKFDETTQFSEMESSVDGPPALSPLSAMPHEGKESESEASIQENSKLPDEKSVDSNVSNQSQEPPAPPIVIPSHLPKKQRELFMRVQQHNQQKLSAVENAESQVKKESEEEEEKSDSKNEESKWYSSEEDDDDSDELLTDVLKKIQQGPPTPKPVETKPAVNLMEMLNKIQQNTLEKKPPGLQQPNLIPFLKDILGPVAPASTTGVTSTVPSIVPDIKRRTLLPNPLLPATPLADPFKQKEIIVPKESPKDPRLKNRDPRTLPTVTNSLNSNKPISSDRNNTENSLSSDLNSVCPKTLPLPVNDNVKDNVPYRLHGIYTRPLNYIPYLHASQSNPKLLNDPRLRKHLQPPTKVETTIGNGKDFEISKPAPSQPPKDIPPIPELLLKYDKPESVINIFESNASSKTSGNSSENKHPLPMAAQRVCDPRIIRRDSRSNSGSDTPPHLTIVDTIRSPPHQDFKSAPVLESVLNEPASEKKAVSPVLEKHWNPPVLEKSDIENVKKESDSDSESNHCPPKLEFSGKTSFKKSPSPEREFIAIPKESPSRDADAPPVVPPLIIKKIKPTLASHLPRAIADPRMAKLHNPVDSRRLRLAPPEKTVNERKTQSSLVNNPKTPAKSTAEKSDSSTIAKSLSGETEIVDKEEKPKSTKSIPKKRRLSDKTEEKKKTVHRNRKSSMDYASPLNSCDDTVSQKSSTYNSYNQRPKRSTNPLYDKNSNSSTESSEISSIPNFLISDNSNVDCDNSIDGNLKDKFKTIDPTASPFC